MVTLVEEASRGTIILTVRVGTVLELKAAQTRILLTFASDPSAITRAHSTLSDAEAAKEKEVLASIRRHRVAWADLDREGLASVAVPVFVRNDVSAAMALIGTTKMLSPTDRSAERVQVLKQAAQTLGAMVAS